VSCIILEGVDNSMLNWDSQLEKLVLEVLEEISVPVGRRSGRTQKPFVTSYQLASALAERNPQMVLATGLPFGGKGVGENRSFVQELAGKLSTRIEQMGNKSPIEIEYLAMDYITSMHFSANPIVNKGNGGYESSVVGKGEEIVLFRLRS
jgi:hypothetical protein